MNLKVDLLKIFCFIGIVIGTVRSEDKNVPDHIMKRINAKAGFSQLVEEFNLGQRFRNFESTGVALQNEPCQPRPVVVEIPQPRSASTFHYPYYVQMYRCTGGCGPLQFVSQCRAKESTKVLTKVISITWSSGRPEDEIAPALKHIELRNDTSCQCGCNHNGQVCNRFQYWDSSACKCQCLSWGCPLNFETHPATCCSCAKPDQVCLGRKKVWSVDKCACVCKNLYKPCRTKGKYRNPYTCKCTCPPITCVESTAFDKNTCQCTALKNHV